MSIRLDLVSFYLSDLLEVCTRQPYRTNRTQDSLFEPIVNDHNTS